MVVPHRIIIGLLLLAVATGCAARFQPMGSALQPPVLDDPFITAPDGYRLPVRSWRPNPRPVPKAVVVALHGFNDYSNAFTPVGPALAKHGYAVFAYDQRGFGATRDPGIWPGTETLVADLEAAGRAVTAAYPNVPLVLMGESMGGAVVLSALAGDHASTWLQTRTAGAVLVAPAVWGWSTLNPLYQATLALAFAMVPGIVLHPPKGLDIQASDNIAMLRSLSRDPLVIKGARVDAVHGLVDLMEDAFVAAPALATPALVLFGDREEVIPLASRDRFLGRLPPDRALVALYPNGYHMLLRDLNAEEVLKDIAAWLDDPTAPLPSGLGRRPPVPSG